MTTVIARNFKNLKLYLSDKQLIKKKIGLVPTMGCLHDGHLSLVKKCKLSGCFTIVTIFVNPIQFNKKKDLLKYPSQERADILILKKYNVDLIFIPKLNDVYPKNFSTYLNESLYSNILCGIKRKGHFSGVLTIVLKLFTLTNPDIAFFGEKDYQQLVIVKKMVKDLNLNITINSVHTVRDQYGLALSSRNKLLRKQELHIARKIYFNLIKVNLCKEKSITYIKRFLKKELINDGIRNIEYLEIREENQLTEVKKLSKKIRARVFIAVKIGKVRLIDNIRI